MTELCMLYSTFASKGEAVSVASALLEEKLAACVTLLPGALSLYRWEGQTKRETEVVLLAKTTAERRENAMARIAALHPYAVPCILSYPANSVFPQYCQWVAKETGSA